MRREKKRPTKRKRRGSITPKHRKCENEERGKHKELRMGRRGKGKREPRQNDAIKWNEWQKRVGGNQLGMSGWKWSGARVK